jgi:hypothetical protein
LPRHRTGGLPDLRNFAAVRLDPLPRGCEIARYGICPLALADQRSLLTRFNVFGDRRCWQRCSGWWHLPFSNDGIHRGRLVSRGRRLYRSAAPGLGARGVCMNWICRQNSD